MEKQKKLPLFRLIIDEEGDTGVLANALVADPANERAFVAFSKESKAIKLASDKMKRNVTGVLIEPDRPIYRRDPKLGEYNVMFTRETIESIVRNYSKNLRFGNVNLEHETPVDGVHMVESWLAGEQDKSKELGFDVPPGTWMGTFHIEDDAVWNEILDGTYTGFSVEGLFGLQPVEMSRHFKTDDEFYAFLEDESIPEAERIAEVEKIIRAYAK